MSPQQLRLPYFEATESKDFPGFLIVWCPRESCPSFDERPFVVHKRTWMKQMKHKPFIGGKETPAKRITGRPCPYCLRASALPIRLGRN
jgi:hypothetical protein